MTTLLIMLAALAADPVEDPATPPPAAKSWGDVMQDLKAASSEPHPLFDLLLCFPAEEPVRLLEVRAAQLVTIPGAQGQTLTEAMSGLPDEPRYRDAKPLNVIPCPDLDIVEQVTP
jgi:hypothetical protein